MSEIRCLCLDVDGVLTDGRIYIGDDGRPTRAFNVQDGLAIEWFQKLAGPAVIISGKESAATATRARELGIKHVIQGSNDKLTDLRKLLTRLELTLDHVALIGDDLPDLPILQCCAFPIAVANAVDEVKLVAHLVTRRSGGHGAVREAVEHLLRTAGRWQEVQAHYGFPPRDGDTQ